MSRFTYTKGITHGGNSFHSDDVVATALCRYFAEKEGFIFEYERKFNISDEEINDRNTIVYDIGEKYSPEKGIFDHHQTEVPKRSDGQEYSSCGLILEEFGPSYFTQKEMQFLKDNITTCIDYHDNGKLVPGETVPINIYEFSALSPTWNEPVEKTGEYFERAVQLAYQTINYELERAHGKSDIETKCQILDKIDERRQFLNDAKILAYVKAGEALDTLKNGIVYMDTFMPTVKNIFADKEFLQEYGNPEVLFVIHPSPRAPYNMSVIPTEPGAFTLSIPEGFNRVISNESDYPQGVSFVHQGGFFAAGKTIEGLEELARRTVENYHENCYDTYHHHEEKKLSSLLTMENENILEEERIA